MQIARFTSVYAYKVMDEIADGKDVMCLNRASGEVCRINSLSVDAAMKKIKEAEAAEDNKGGYGRVAQFEFWYAELEDINDEKEAEENDTV